MDISVTFIGNATTLISYGELTLLTDPNFLHQGQYAYLGYGLVSKRLREPARTISELPPIDAITLSHMHGDHWDRTAQRDLDHALPILTTPHAAKRLRRRGFTAATGMQTWGSEDVIKGDNKVRVTSLPGRHAPAWTWRMLPPVMGSMLEFGPIEGPPQRRLYVSGDTLLIEDLAEIPGKFDAIDAGLLHLGGTRLPAGPRLPFGLTVTMDGAQGAGLVDLLNLPRAIPLHYDDYTVFASPLSDFEEHMRRRGWVDRIIRIGRGETVSL
ncbi:MBL fold metallo-hydrolase [Skermania sp. ID1734]|uniref:MBL fold metallo-hydrolase n=1 Tax=Skermania sp. ID1734 TaxID=2597516 RepID=UPI00117FE871|nr:MBL fold metallo-hydrolase [Skermania sp. ID1734]TSD99792.1 MBL fold metallo-hydrolase [Skermania sp. ID1734]